MKAPRFSRIRGGRLAPTKRTDLHQVLLFIMHEHYVFRQRGSMINGGSLWCADLLAGKNYMRGLRLLLLGVPGDPALLLLLLVPACLPGHAITSSRGRVRSLLLRWGRAFLPAISPVLTHLPCGNPLCHEHLLYLLKLFIPLL